jgi:hypothetical protein
MASLAAATRFASASTSRYCVNGMRWVRGPREASLEPEGFGARASSAGAPPGAGVGARVSFDTSTKERAFSRMSSFAMRACDYPSRREPARPQPSIG